MQHNQRHNQRYYHHEHIARGEDLMARLASAPIVLCGAGALGANLALHLARSGARDLTVIDHDRVEEHNLSTQPWSRAELGQRKATMLANQLYRALGVRVTAHTTRLTEDNALRLLGESALVVDVFDNSASRRTVQEACATLRVPCLHAGMADGYGEVIWNEHYRVPGDPAHQPTHDACDYPLTRTLIMLTVAIAGEAIMEHLASGSRQGYTVTARDLTIRPHET